MSAEHKHSQLRKFLAVTALGALGTVGVVTGARALLTDAPRPKAAASGSLVPGTATPENPIPQAIPSATLEVRRMTPAEIATTYATREPSPTTKPAETQPAATATKGPDATATTASATNTSTVTAVPPTATEKATTAPATSTSTPPAKDTATAVPATKVPDKAPATAVPASPESNRFPSYGVYANEDTFVATLPDGRIIVAVRKDSPRCSNPNYPALSFIESSRYSPGKDNAYFKASTSLDITVSLKGDGNKLAMVTVKEKGHEANGPDGSFTCPAVEYRSKVELVGDDNTALVAYAQKAGVVSSVDAAKALQQIEQAVGKLPD